MCWSRAVLHTDVGNIMNHGCVGELWVALYNYYNIYMVWSNNTEPCTGEGISTANSKMFCCDYAQLLHAAIATWAVAE